VGMRRIRRARRKVVAILRDEEPTIVGKVPHVRPRSTSCVALLDPAIDALLDPGMDVGAWRK
jgi:hypothetical protein